MSQFLKVAKTADLDEGEMMMVEVSGEQVLLCKVDGKFHAISDVCTHAEGSLSDGYLEGVEVECPLHGSRFDVRTGEAVGLPATDPVQRFAVRVEGNDILVGPA